MTQVTDRQMTDRCNTYIWSTMHAIGQRPISTSNAAVSIALAFESLIDAVLQIDRQATNRPANMHTDGQTNRQTDRQAGRQTDHCHTDDMRCMRAISNVE